MLYTFGPVESIPLQIDRELLAKLDELAESMGRDRNSLIREALAQYVATQEWEVDEILKAIQEADRGDAVNQAALRAAVLKTNQR